MYIDTHAHLNFKAFDDDRGEVIKKSLDNGVWMINASSNYKTSQLAVEIAQQYPSGVFASIGLHPINCVVDLSQLDEDRLEELDIEKYRELSKEKGVVAIGEIGLDYAVFSREWSERMKKRASAEAVGEGGLGEKEESAFAKAMADKQKEVFLKQVELARELSLPIILHCRKAHKELLEELRIMNYESGIGRGVVHCFTGNWEEAQKYIELGFYLGFNGIIWKMDLNEVIKKIPLERMLLETDCPFLSPPIRENSFENSRELVFSRNEPVNIKHIAQRIAEIRGESLETISDITTQNAKKLFNLN